MEAEEPILCSEMAWCLDIASKVHDVDVHEPIHHDDPHPLLCIVQCATAVEPRALHWHLRLPFSYRFQSKLVPAWAPTVHYRYCYWGWVEDLLSGTCCVVPLKMKAAEEVSLPDPAHVLVDWCAYYTATILADAIEDLNTFK